ncbi:hypothetical protein ES702_07568 [subsurface metagenome]
MFNQQQYYEMAIYLRKEFSIYDLSDIYLKVSSDNGVDIFMNDGVAIPLDTDATADWGHGNNRHEFSLWNNKISFNDINPATYLIDNDNDPDPNTIAIKMIKGPLLNVSLYQAGGAPVWENEDFIISDATGDGLKDLILIQHTNGYTFIKVSEKTETGQNPYVIWAVTESSHIGKAQWLSGDITGDGRCDIIKVIPFSDDVVLNDRFYVTLKDESIFEVFISEAHSQGDRFVRADWTPYSWPENLLKNSIFVTKDPQNNELVHEWTPKLSCTLKRKEWIFYTGNISCYVESRPNNTSGPMQDIKDALLSKGKGSYHAAAYVKPDTGTPDFRVTIELTDSSGTHTINSASTNCHAYGFSKISDMLNITWSGTLTSAYFIVDSISSTTSFYVDNCILEKKPDIIGNTYFVSDFNHDGIDDIARVDEDETVNAPVLGRNATKIYSSDGAGLLNRNVQIYEAESVENIRTGDAERHYICRPDFLSGGHVVTGINNSSGSYLEFPNILAIPSSQADSHTLTIYYQDGSPKNVDIFCNNNFVQTMYLPGTGGFDEFHPVGSETITLNLDQEINNIRVTPQTSCPYYVDKIEIGEANPQPDIPLYYYEAEDGVLGGTTDVGTHSFCSRGLKVNGIGNGESNDLSIDVIVDTTQTYTCTVYYTCSEDREGIVSVNGDPGTTYQFAASGIYFPGSITIPVELNAGANTVRFYNALSPMADIDCITLVQGINPDLPLPTPSPTPTPDPTETPTPAPTETPSPTPTPTPDPTETPSPTPIETLPWIEDFGGLVNGTTSDTGETAWDSTRPGGVFEVNGNRFVCNGPADEGVWTTEVIDISQAGSVNISVDIDDGDDNKESSDYVKVYYKLDGGGEQLAGHVTDDISARTISATDLSGSTLQIIIRAKVSYSNEYYYWDNVTVETGPEPTPTPDPASGLPWEEDFNNLADGTISDTGETAWDSTRPGGVFEVSGNRFVCNGPADEGVWTTEVIDISQAGSITISVDVDDGDTNKESSDYVKVYYKLDGGGEQLAGQVTGDISAQTISQSGISGNTVQVVIRAKVSYSNEFYYWDNVIGQ